MIGTSTPPAPGTPNWASSIAGVFGQQKRDAVAGLEPGQPERAREPTRAGAELPVGETPIAVDDGHRVRKDGRRPQQEADGSQLGAVHLRAGVRGPRRGGTHNRA